MEALGAYRRLTQLFSHRWTEGAALLLVRVALAGVFWRSGRSKVTEDSWLQISDTTRYLFETEYAGVPFPPAIAAPMATYAEHVFPILLVIGFLTRFSAVSLLAMTLVIQVFVFPEAWWTTHIVWVALAAILVSRGSGIASLDAAIAGWREK